MKFKNLIFPIAVFGLLVFGGNLLVKQAQADDLGGNGRNGVIERLIERFNLNKDEVNDELNQMQEERQAEMQTRHEERLQQAVEDGVITEAQKQALIDKQNEIQQKQQQIRQEMQTWMEESGIDFEALHEYGCGAGLNMGGPGFGHGFKGI
jgi:competence protein ComGC